MNNNPVKDIRCFLKNYIILFIFVLAILPFCSKDTVREYNVSKGIDMEFREEGLISKDIYRVIIVEPKDKNISSNKINIENLAKRRALLSLQKYLRSNNVMINRNVEVALLNLIDPS